MTETVRDILAILKKKTDTNTKQKALANAAPDVADRGRLLWLAFREDGDAVACEEIWLIVMSKAPDAYTADDLLAILQTKAATVVPRPGQRAPLFTHRGFRQSLELLAAPKLDELAAAQRHDLPEASRWRVDLLLALEGRIEATDDLLPHAARFYLESPRHDSIIARDIETSRAAQVPEGKQAARAPLCWPSAFWPEVARQVEHAPEVGQTSLIALAPALEAATPEQALALAAMIYEPQAPMSVIDRIVAKGEEMVEATRSALAPIAQSTDWRDEKAQRRYLAILGRLGAHDALSTELLDRIIQAHREEYRRALNIVQHASGRQVVASDVEELCAALMGVDYPEDLVLKAPMALAPACVTGKVIHAAFDQLLDTGAKGLIPRGDDKYDYEQAFPFLVERLVAVDKTLAGAAMGRLISKGAPRSEKLIDAFAPLGHPEAPEILIKLLAKKPTRPQARNALLSMADQGSFAALEKAASGQDKRLANAARKVLEELRAVAPQGKVTVTAEVVELLEQSRETDAAELYKQGGAKARDSSDQTLLHLLLRSFRRIPSLAQVVSALLEEGADPRVKDGGGICPLPLAIHSENSSPDVVDMLIEAGADPLADDAPEPPPGKSVSPRDYTLWMSFREDLHRHLIATGVDVSPRPAFVASAGYGEDAALRRAIDNGNIAQDLLDDALQRAALMGRKDTTALLLDTGANPTAKGGQIIEQARGAAKELLQERMGELSRAATVSEMEMVQTEGDRVVEETKRLEGETESKALGPGKGDKKS